MKARKILLLFTIVIATLLALTFLFPREGIAAGGITLRFPTLHALASRDNVGTTEIANDTVPGQMNLGDSIAFYRRLTAARCGSGYRSPTTSTTSGGPPQMPGNRNVPYAYCTMATRR